jgi:hypothetical protein
MIILLALDGHLAMAQKALRRTDNASTYLFVFVLLASYFDLEHFTQLLWCLSL